MTSQVPYRKELSLPQFGVRHLLAALTVFCVMGIGFAAVEREDRAQHRVIQELQNEGVRVIYNGVRAGTVVLDADAACPRVISKLRKLNGLDLLVIRFAALGPEATHEIGQLRQLRELHIRKSTFRSNELISAIRQLPRLRFINLTGSTFDTADFIKLSCRKHPRIAVAVDGSDLF